MKIEKVIKDSFKVIGKEGSTSDGDQFIQKLWEEANSHFAEIAHFAKRDEKGNPVGIWGAMSDFTHSFKPWENFKKVFIWQVRNVRMMHMLLMDG